MIYGVVGNREGWDYSFVRRKLIEIGITPEDTISSGGAEGVDTYAQMLAKEIGCRIIIDYPNNRLPSPQRYYDRNKEIAKVCNILIAFDHKVGSSGTKNTIAHCKSLGKKIILFQNAQN